MTNPSPWTLPKSCNVSRARARVEGENLVVDTGTLRRVWRRTTKGLVTVGLTDPADGREWVDASATRECDWSIPGLKGQAELVSLAGRPSDDEGFTSKHLEVVATFAYPRAALAVQYVIWAWPGVAGLRTQIRLRAEAGYAAPSSARAGGVSEYLPVALRQRRLHAIGYYSGTQNRNKRGTEILKERVLAPPPVRGRLGWPSVLAVRAKRRGLVMVKESHKCCNTPGGGANTGGFVWDAEGIRTTGLGWRPGEIGPDRWHACWANWLIAYTGGDDEMALAVKMFDRVRYPIDPKRDLYVMANTWGSSLASPIARTRAAEANVLVEIDSQADLGIDVQQIDDGWQGDDHKTWKLDRTRYPRGWGRVVRAARDRGVTLGLWAAWWIPDEDLLRHYDRAGFRYFKIDFAVLDTMAKVDEQTRKLRRLILHSGHQVRVNWDLTEKCPRVGYFYGRDCGNVYLANRKPYQPKNVVYKPYLVLRDAWQLATWLNLNKFQITTQNPDRTNPRASDAHRHPHDYCLAQTLMGSPIFFQETQFLGEDARRQIRPLLALYKKHRAAMFRGYVFPLGAKPDNAAWSGFQNHNPAGGSGYLTIFRQRLSRQRTHRLALHFLAGQRIRLRDLQRGESRVVDVPSSGKVSFTIDDAPGFAFLRYEPAEDQLPARAKKARKSAFQKVLDRVPKRKPLPGDEV